MSLESQRRLVCVTCPKKKGMMAMCDSCNVWYHHHCIDIPSEVFGGESH